MNVPDLAGHDLENDPADDAEHDAVGDRICKGHDDDGEEAAASSADYIVVNQVYGGNDIAGQIGTAAAVNEPVPSELTAVKRDAADATNLKKNDVDDTFNSYVRVSTRALSTTYTAEEIAAAADNPDDPAYGKSTTDVKPDPSAKKVYIGQLFGGGNGDFDYASSDAPGGKVTHTIYNRNDHTTPIAQITTEPGEVGFHLPEQNKTYLEVVGGWGSRQPGNGGTGVGRDNRYGVVPQQEVVDTEV